MSEAGAPRPGDKIAVLRGARQGARGVIHLVSAEAVVVRFPDGTESLPVGALVNYSAAARRAWQTRPHRAVGRPKDPRIPPKRMVSLRLDVEVWEGLRRAAEMGLIGSRESAVNTWLREKLEELRGRKDRRGKEHE